MLRIFEVPLLPGNISATHLPTGGLLSYLPPSVVGGRNKSDGLGSEVTLEIDGIKHKTDIAERHESIFRLRKKSVVGAFYDANNAKAGDILVYEETAPLRFRLSIKNAKTIKKQKQREKKWVEIDPRPDQQKFRNGIVARDGLKCAITGCDVPAVLDAAHLDKRAGGGSDDPSNGIILRTDLHRLFDAGLIQMQPSDGRISVSRELTNSLYHDVDGVLPLSKANFSNVEKRALDR